MSILLFFSTFTSFNYLATPQNTTLQPRPLRQHSNESQSSIHSSEQESKHKSPSTPSREKKPAKEFIDQQQPLSVFRVNDPNLENFSTSKGTSSTPKASSSSSHVIKTSVNLINPFITSMSGGRNRLESQSATEKSLIDDSETVEHRRLSNEQRSVSYDSRRNGMIDLLSSSAASTLTSVVNPFDVEVKPKLQTQQQQIVKANSVDVDSELCTKTENLKLNEPSPSSSSTGAIAKISNGSVKNQKATGAIPKSISFDSTADKAERNHHRRSEISSRNAQHQSTGIFNKIRQGFKKKGKHARNSIDETENVSDIINGSPNRATTGNGFSEINQVETTDDILAKYRRKPSSSSDAATSDSAGSNNSSSLKSKSSDTENR